MVIETKNGNNWQAGEAMVKVLRAWDRYEGRNGKSQPKIKVIDIDVAPVSGPPYFRIEDRNDVERALMTISSATNPTEEDGEYLGSKAIASNAYLRHLRSESPPPLNDYLVDTMGIEPQRVLEPTLKAQKTVVESLFKELGFTLNQAGWRQFLNRYRLDPKAITKKFTESKDIMMPKLLEVLGEQDLNPQYQTKFIPVNEQWIAWVSGNRNTGFTLEVNTHPRHQDRWFLGATETSTIHEVCGHILQGKLLQRNIDRLENQINPGFGITTIPGPEQWSLEGLATTLPYLVRPLYDSLTLHGRLALELRILQHLVYNNIQLTINRKDPLSDKDLNTLKEKIRDYLPCEDDKTMDAKLAAGRDDPRYRSYLMAYQRGSRYFWEKSRQLSPDQCIQLVKMLYVQPMTPQQIERYVNEELIKIDQHEVVASAVV